MNCERCAHELVYDRSGTHPLTHHSDECIANLRADLAATRDERDQAVNDLMAEHELALRGLRADLEAERARSWEGWDRGSILGTALLATKRLWGQAVEHAARAEVACAAMREALRWAYALSLTIEGALLTTVGGFTLAVMHLRVVFDDALKDDAGRNLLMAVQRLMEAAVIAAEALEFADNWTSIQVRTALADPSLAGLQRTHEKMSHQDADRERD